MRLDQPLADHEPEARSRGRALGAVRRAGVFAEQVGQPLRRDAPALVGDRDLDMESAARGRDPDRGGLRRVPRGVGEKVVQHLYDAPAVGHDRGQVPRQVDEHGVPAAAGEKCGARPVDQLGHLRALRRNGERARLDAPRVEQVADQAAHVPGLVVDDAVELVPLGRVDLRRGFQQRRGRPLDGGERRPQLVAHHAEELRAQPLDLMKRREILHGHDHRHHRAVFGTDRRSVDQHRDAAAVRDREHDFLGAHGLSGAELLRDGELSQADLAAVSAAAGYHLEQLLRGAAGGAQALDDAPRLAVDRGRTARSRIEHHDADRRGLDQRLEVGSRPPLVAIGARIGYGGRRLRGEQHQHLLVLGRERRSPLFLGDEEMAHEDVAVAHRRALEGLREHQVRGEAKGADQSGEVGQPDRPRKVAQMREELRSVRPLEELAVLLVSEAGGDEVAHLAGVVDGRDDAVARVGEPAGALQHLAEHGVQVERGVDTQDGRAQRGDPFAERRDLQPCFPGLVQRSLLPGPGTAPGSNRPSTAPRRRPDSALRGAAARTAPPVRPRFGHPVSTDTKKIFIQSITIWTIYFNFRSLGLLQRSGRVDGGQVEGKDGPPRAAGCRVTRPASGRCPLFLIRPVVLPALQRPVGFPAFVLGNRRDNEDCHIEDDADDRKDEEGIHDRRSRLRLPASPDGISGTGPPGR